MAGYYEAMGLLKQAQAALRQADQLIEVICREGEPSDIMGLADVALQLKACLGPQLQALALAAPIGALPDVN
jgi:hypothetical protein